MNKRTIIRWMVMLVFGLVLSCKSPVSVSAYSANQYSGGIVSDGSVVIGEEAVVYFAMERNPGMYAGSYTLTYDPTQLQYMGCSAAGGVSQALVVENEKKEGTVSIAFVSPGMINGAGNMVAMRFQTKKDGDTRLQIDDLKLTDPNMEEMSLTGTKTYTLSVAKMGKTTVTLKNGAGVVQVAWKKVRGASGYYVYRKMEDGKYSRIKQISSGDTVLYKDKTVKAGTTYIYTVRAYNKLQTGDSATPKKNLYLAPVKVTKVKNTGKSLRLSWKKTKGAKGYDIYRRVGKGSYQKVARVKGASKVVYEDKKVTNKKKYTYKVTAYYGTYRSADSNKKTITFKKK